MRARLLAASVMLVGLSHAACVACNDIGCSAGFFWTASPEEADALEVGTYAIALEIEGSSYTVECTVAEDTGASACTHPMRTAGAVDFFVMFELAFESGAPPHGFMMRAWEEDGERSLRGPQHVDITITHEGAPIVDIEYELEYVRHPTFWGDRRCGYCDLSETRSLTWQ